jgi:hypothetical protein
MKWIKLELDSMFPAGVPRTRSKQFGDERAKANAIGIATPSFGSVKAAKFIETLEISQTAKCESGETERPLSLLAFA